ncbi:MAG: DUF559 domain-containing protein [Actinomycetales bacterium]|nr:DUF559 domain-containing protein [Actinomycetales bacterium]
MPSLRPSDRRAALCGRVRCVSHGDTSRGVGALRWILESALTSNRQGQSAYPVREATCCHRAGCPARGVLHVSSTGDAGRAKFYLSDVPQPPEVVAYMIGAPRESDISTYEDFRYLYAPAPTGYLIPDQTHLLIRHRGVIRKALPIVASYYSESPRRTEDEAYVGATGRRSLGPGHVIEVGRAISLRRAFPWLDARHHKGLVAGSVRDPAKDGEPFNWQAAMLVRTNDRRRAARAPFGVARSSDFKTARFSSVPERQLAEHLAALGLPVCSHVHSVLTGGKWDRPDIVIPGARVIVEFDGSYWHHGQAKRNSDWAKSQRLMSEGWRVLRVRDHGLERIPHKGRQFAQVVVGARPSTAQTAEEVLRALQARRWW